MKSEIPVAANGSPSTYIQSPPTLNSFRIQKRSQRPGSVVDVEAVARGLSANEKQTSHNRLQTSPLSSTAGLSDTDSASLGSFEIAGVQADPPEPQKEPRNAAGVYAYPAVAQRMHDMARNSNGVVDTEMSMTRQYMANATTGVTSPSVPVWKTSHITRQTHIPNPNHEPCCHVEVVPRSDMFMVQGNNGHSQGANGFFDRRETPISTMTDLDIRKQTSGTSQTLLPDSSKSYESSPFSLFQLPSSYATSSHPLSATQFAQMQNNANQYIQQMPLSTSHGMFHTTTPFAERNYLFKPAHNCHCGDGCSCLGCAAHPYNETTKNHVQNLGQILAQGTDDSPTQSRPGSHYEFPSTSIDIHSMSNGTRPVMAGNLPSPMSLPTDVTNLHASANDIGGITTSIEPGFQPGPVYSSSNYYTMEFEQDPNDLFSVCTDVTGSCRCGDDCACLGCLTHTGHETQAGSNNADSQYSLPVGQTSESESTTNRTIPA